MRSNPCGMVASAVLALALALGGCGGSEGDNARRPARELPGYDINPVARDQISEGGTLRWPISGFPAQWNYLHLNGTKLETLKVLRAVLPVLFRVDEKAVPSPNPHYLTGAKVTATESRQVVTYTINPKARWSDGTPMSYRDFAALWRVCGGKNPRYQVSFSTGYEQIESVERGRDDRQAVVTFAEPFADWRGLFSPLVPAHTISTPGDFNQGWVNTIPVTGGPFRLREINKTAKTVTVVRDDRWWGPKSRLDQIVFRGMSGDAEAGAFANGEVDLLDVGADASSLKTARRVAGAAIRMAAGPDFRHITFNGASPVLSDVNVRKAIAVGIDQKAIARSDLQGLDWPAEPLGNHFFMRTQEGYRDNSGELGGFDAAKARVLLERAGWRQRGDYRQKNGTPFVLRFVIPSGIPASKREGELVQAMLKDIGVKVDVRVVPFDDFFDDYVVPGNFDLAPFSWNGTPFPVSAARSIYASPKRDDIQQNFARIGSARIDRAMDRAIAELDPARARSAANAADKLIWAEVHSLPLYQRPQIVAVKSTLANIGAFGFYEPVYENIGYTR